ncbi:MAG TPA: N-6 DNA methylase, partial [Vicinamibacterales bacterium]|nr:N-6 DNA methylase [Vicinamibacterales bacterium]
MLGALTSLVSALRISGRTARAGTPPTAVFDQALIIVYRLLFLLFAEAHAAVPTWHHIYREAYTISALCRRGRHGAPRQGLWEAVQAISRLAHSGCEAGDLRVTAFNGRLFSPRHAPLAESARIPNPVMQQTLNALVLGSGMHPQRPIAYADLGVEQLGAVYERVLEYEPVSAPAPSLLTRTSRERKSTGSFYTPRSITEFLVRRTLHPLVEGRSPDEILSIRIVDPAMGSGAFLVAACRYLAAAAEHARVAGGEWRQGEVTRAERVELRRAIAQRCLYGVDLNPMAVQLARLSLWLTTLAVDRPLTFLDHHLACGDSLIGASLEDLARPAPGTTQRRPALRHALPLFDHNVVETIARHILPERYRLAFDPEHTASEVRAKERALAALTTRSTPLARWKAAADLWCAAWFWNSEPLTAGAFGDLMSATLGRAASLPRARLDPLLAQAAQIARERRAFHWELEFPEIFFGEDGLRRCDGGFDAVITNPPWDVLRADTGTAADRLDERRSAAAQVRFFRDSGVYRLHTSGHANRYQVFLERAMQLVRPGGRLGLILPSGFASDHSCSRLRQTFMDRARIERLLGFHNVKGIFPIHRDVRFLLLTAIVGERTERVPCRFGCTDAAWLETLPDAAVEDPAGARPISLTREAIREWDPEHSTIPELIDPIDQSILVRVSSAVPKLADARGWAIRFG